MKSIYMYEFDNLEMKSSDWLRWSSNGLYASFHHPCFELMRNFLKNFFGLTWFSNFQSTNQIKAGVFGQWEAFIYLETGLSVNYSFQNHLNRKKDRWIFGRAQTGRYHVTPFDHLSDFSAAFHRHPNRPLHRNRHYRHLEYDEIRTSIKFWLTPQNLGARMIQDLGLG